MKLTKQQQEALMRLYERKISVRHRPFKAPPCQSYASFRRTVQIGSGCVMVFMHNMWFGIEPDGYTHT